MSTYTRTLISLLSLARPLYSGGLATVYQVEENGDPVLVTDPETGEQVQALVTLYADQEGTETLENPQLLNTDGRWASPAYVEVPYRIKVTSLGVPDHETGVVTPNLSAAAAAEAELNAQLAQEAAARAEAAAAEVIARAQKEVADEALLKVNNLSDVEDALQSRTNVRALPGIEQVIAVEPSTTYTLQPADDGALVFLKSSTGNAEVVTPSAPRDGYTVTIMASTGANECRLNLGAQQLRRESKGTTPETGTLVLAFLEVIRMVWVGGTGWYQIAGDRIPATRLRDVGDIRLSVRGPMEAVSTSRQLLAADMGKNIGLTAPGATCTLPFEAAMDTTQYQNTRILITTESNSATISTGGSHLIYYSGKLGGTSNLPINAREAIELRYRGSNVWIIDSYDAPTLLGVAGMEKIDERVIGSTVASVDFTGLGNYMTVQVELEVVPNQSGRFELLLGDSTGFTPGNLAYASGYGLFGQAGATSTAAWGHNGGSGAGENPQPASSTNGTMVIQSMGTTRPTMSWVGQIPAGGTWANGAVKVPSPNYGAIEQIRFRRQNGGNWIDSGEFKVYGIRRP